VTPHAWSVPHDTNEHVAGLADALRVRGHHVVVLAPSSRSKELLAGRRALQEGRLDGVVALARAVPVSPRSAVGIPVGVRANVATALRRGDFDVVHGFDPGVAGLSYVALLEAETTTVATFVDPERLGYPPRRNQRDRLLARIDTLLASSEDTAARARERFPGAFAIVAPGVSLDLSAPVPKQQRVVIETSAGSLPVVRSVLRALRTIDGWDAILLRTGRLAARPSIPLALRDRVHVRTALTGKARAEILRGAAIVVPSPDGLRRLQAEAAAASRAVEARAADLDRQIAFEVSQRWLELDSSRAAIGAAADGVRSATEARRVVTERFRAGVITSSDVVDADLAVLQAELDLTRARANARLAEARLNRAVGR
jgi:hypothetical protein